VTERIASLDQLTGRYDAVFCDLWGCLHNGVTAFPAAVDALRVFRAGGGKVLLLTNSPRPKVSVEGQLARIGVPRDCWDEIASSGDAAQFALVTGAVGHKVHHIGAEKDLTFFTDFAPDVAAAAGAPITLVPTIEAEGVVCTGLRDDLTETPDDYRATLLLAKTRELPMLCANPDIVVDMGDRRLWCAGAIAEAYEKMGGTVLYFGKPHPPIYDLARRRLAALVPISDPQILCIGDGIDTDIRGGVAEGFDTLFLTGGIAEAELGAEPDQARLEDWLNTRMLSPTFVMRHLV
jgi:HAD superfamily hydrolase (TIGR01459 family)